MSNGQWTEQDVMDLVVNPVYAGLGLYPPLISDDMFIQAQRNLIKQKGIRRTLIAMREALHATYGIPMKSISHPEWLDQAVRAIKRVGETALYRRLLAELRAELDELCGE